LRKISWGLVIVVVDERLDLGLEIAGQVVVLQQDAVLQGLMPALDLALRLRMTGRAADMVHGVVGQPLGFAAQAFEDDTDLVLGRMMLAGGATDVAHHPLGWQLGGGGGGSRAHLHSPEGYDEPDILRSSTPPLRLKGADAGQSQKTRNHKQKPSKRVIEPACRCD
jgi:hypothetical protein